jgi:DNA polymerase bacteriophage-type
MQFAVIDFETRCTVNIKAGASRYSQEAEVMCLSYSLDGGMNVSTWYPGQPDPQDLFDAIEKGIPVFAHNASFEICIWRNVMVAKYGWPEIGDKQWRCTMSEALAAGLPKGLEKIADGLELTVKKDMAGRRMMLKMAKPRRPTKKDASVWHEKPEEKIKLYAYCEQDVISEIAVHNAVPRLSTRELSVYHYDQLVNRRGIMIDRELAESAVALWAEHRTALNNELKRLTNGEVETSRQLKNMEAFLEKNGFDAYAGLTKGAVGGYMNEDLPPTVRRILEIRQELALSSVSKYEAMLRSIEHDDRVRGCLQYHAAQTGRWGGRLIQTQNFPRGVLKEDEIEDIITLVKKRDTKTLGMLMPIGDLLSSLLRSAIIPAPGKKFIVCDFAAIEARGLAWAAGEKWLLEAFETGDDVYKAMASDIYKVPVKEVTKDQRFYGKTCILGCGYSMGSTKFQMALANFGVEASFEFCDAVVKAYRKKNAKIVAYWYDTQRAATKAIELGGEHKAGPFSYFVKNDWLWCKMPTGRLIGYYKPSIEPGKYGPQIGYLGVDIHGKLVKTTTYSGKLVENNIQAVCRDILVEGLSRLEQNGYEVVMHVHDEAICEVDENFGSPEEMERILSVTPDWAKGFPIAAEGYQAKRYRK